MKGVITFISTALVALSVSAAIYTAKIWRDLNDSVVVTGKLYPQQRPQSTVILDRHGEVIYKTYDTADREYVSIDDVPESLLLLIVASEDADFYEHNGFDTRALTRCTLRTTANHISAGLIGTPCGASTITQQLLRNTVLHDQYGDEAYKHTFRRKYRELILSYIYEKKFSKEEILELYINEVPLGGPVYGVKSAARYYFDKDLDELTLAESAYIAGLIQQPSSLSPVSASDERINRRINYSLTQLEKYIRKHQNTDITLEQIAAAKQEKITFNIKDFFEQAPHFSLAVISQLQSNYVQDSRDTGYIVHTTLDLQMQQEINDMYDTAITQNHSLGIRNGGVIVIDSRTGEVLTWIGSPDYFANTPYIHGSIDNVTHDYEFGALYHPFIYLTAIKDGYGIWLETPDIENFDYEISNADLEYLGPMTARESLAINRNIPALYTLELTGEKPYIQTLNEAGIHTAKNLSGLEDMVIGKNPTSLLDITSAYTVLASEGRPPQVHIIDSIETTDGEEIFKYHDTERQLYSNGLVYPINLALCNLDRAQDRKFEYLYDYYYKEACGKTGVAPGPTGYSAIAYDKRLTIGSVLFDTGTNTIKWDNTINPGLEMNLAILAKYRRDGVADKYTKPDGLNSGLVCNVDGAITDKLHPSQCAKTSIVYNPTDHIAYHNETTVFLCKYRGDYAVLSPYNGTLEHNPLFVKKILLYSVLPDRRRNEQYADYLAKSTQYISHLPPTSGIGCHR